jgi:predicted outer membrane repeat protein
MFTRWIRKWVTRSERRPSRNPQAAYGSRPLVEVLEDRTLPTTFTVVCLDDTGAGTDTSGDLRYVINQANAAPGPHEIDFAVTGTITLGSALPDLNSDMALLGPGSANLTVQRDQASGTPQFSVFIVDAGNTVTFSGLTISGGDALSGGGIHNQDGTVTVSNCTFTGNAATLGGAIENTSGATLTISNSSFSGNSASFAGGAIDNESSTVTISGSSFANNSASDDGGAIYSLQSTLNIDNSSFDSNSTDQGGAIYGDINQANINNCYFHDNSARMQGGAIYNFNRLGTGTTITNSTFSGNSALTQGGAIDADSINGDVALTVINSTMTGNSAHKGGAMFIQFADSVGLVVRCCTISANSVDSEGQGGGMIVQGAFTLVDTIVAGNTRGSHDAAVTDDIQGNVNLGRSGHNLIGDGTNSNMTDGVSGNIVGTADSPVNPGLGPLQDNGGPTPTMALLAGSPALQAGTTDGAPDTDQRGLPRVVNGLIDIGAFEVQSS